MRHYLGKVHAVVIIKFKTSRWDLPRLLEPNPVTRELVRGREKKTQRERRGQCEEGGGDEGTKPWTLRNSWNHEELEKAGMDFLLEPSEAFTVLPITKHKSASFRRLASRKVGEQISVF